MPVIGRDSLRIFDGYFGSEVVVYQQAPYFLDEHIFGIPLSSMQFIGLLVWALGVDHMALRPD